MVTWSRDSLVLSADNVKVLMDSRLRVDYSPLGGVNISIRRGHNWIYYHPSHSQTPNLPDPQHIN